MTHITNNSQRSMNAEINACMNHNTRRTPIMGIDWDGEECVIDYREEYTCGPDVTLSAAQDKCSKCGKIFTY